MINLFQTQYNQTKLTPKKLNEEIRLFVKEKNIIKSTENQVWDKKVFIDLSKIEWINTSALVELILIIENLIEHGIMVTVVLPNKNMLSAEARNLKDHPEHKQFIEHAIEERRKAKEWLYRLKIIQALSFEHQPDYIRSNINILDQFDKELFDQNPVEEESDYYKIHGSLDAEQKDIGEKYHVPLLWTKGYDYHSDYIKNILKERLDISHAQIISDIVINELVKNVNDHSSKKHGLFCAAVGKHNPTKIFKTDYYESDIPFFKRCNEGEYIIEIVFGDSGDGIIQKLNDYGNGKTGADLVRYSFDKWSTSIPYEDDYNSFVKRGTRGLYHVRRVVQNYDGMAAIRTKNFFAGFNDLTSEDINETKLQEFNGTLLTLRLLPGRGKTLTGRYYPTTKLAEKNASDCERLSIDVNNISESIKLVGGKSKINSSKNFLISLDFNKLSNEKLSDKKTLNAHLRELLASLSNLRHPNVHIIYGFPTDFKDTRIEAIVNGVNEAVKLQRERNKYLVFDPIMIIGPRGNVHWAGVQDPKFVSFLNKLMETENLSLPIDDIDQMNHRDLIEYIKQDAELFCIQNESIKLNFNKNAPIEYFKKEIQTKIEDLVKKGGQERRILVTPHLKYVKGWFDINKIYKNWKNEYALSLYSLWHNHRFKIFKTLFPDRLLKKEKKQDCSNEALDNIQRDLLKDNLKILVGSEIDIPSGEMFLHLLDIRNQSNLIILSDEEDSKKPRRNRLFDEDDYVIIITSVVSTAETAKNLIKSVLRSNATPVCLLSLADFSDFEFEKDQEPIKQWGNPVLFYSIITTKDLIASEPKKNVEYKSLIGNGNEKTPQNQSFYIEKELRKGILNSKSLHFSHIGKSNGRHFTFYFNAKRFLNEKNGPNIWRKLKDVINKLYRSIEINLDDLTEELRRTVGTLTSVWYPDREYKKGYQGQGIDLSTIIKDGLKEDYKIDLDDVKPTSREEDTPVRYFDQIPETDKYKIIVDWGSITGESIEKLIYKAHRHGFKNILVCIFLNQLSDKKKAYLTSISTVTSDFPFREQVEQVSTGARQLELFEVKKPEQKKLIKEDPNETKSFISNVRIEFIHDFPLTCYESDYECNVCALREDLEKYEIPNAALEKHAKSRRMALDIRPREITEYEPFDFYSRPDDEEDEKNIPLDEEFILRMFEFKTLLIYAQASTYWRLRTKIEFIGILKFLIDYKDAGRINPSSEKENEIWTQIIEDCNDITNHFKKMFPEMYNTINGNDYHIDEIMSRTHAMIYFLSIETSWIQKPPLSNVELRQMLSLISRAIIFNSNLKISTEKGSKHIEVVRIKYAAITVLRMADKNGFIKNIYEILKNTQIEDIGSNSIIENVLFHTNTFISKEYHYAHDELDTLYLQLENVEKLFIEKHPKYPLIKDAIWSLRLNAESLGVKGELRKLRKRQIVSNCLAIIEHGISNRYNHTKLWQSFTDLRIQPSATGLSIDNELEYFRSNYIKNWQYVAGFIKNIFGLYLKEISSVLSSDWAIGKGAQYLSYYLYTKNIGVDDPFSLLIKKIDETNFNCLNDPSFIKEYDTNYSIIQDLFISYPHYNKDKSTVIKILEGLNSNLETICLEVKKKYQDQLIFKGFENFSFIIFYPKDWAEELFEQLCQNAVERTIGSVLPEIIFEVKVETADYVELKVIYKNTNKEKVRSGKGLLKHKENLPKFDGFLVYDPQAPGDFFVEMRLLKYG